MPAVVARMALCCILAHAPDTDTALRWAKAAGVERTRKQLHGFRNWNRDVIEALRSHRLSQAYRDDLSDPHVRLALVTHVTMNLSHLLDGVGLDDAKQYADLATKFLGAVKQAADEAKSVGEAQRQAEQTDDASLSLRDVLPDYERLPDAIERYLCDALRRAAAATAAPLAGAGAAQPPLAAAAGALPAAAGAPGRVPEQPAVPGPGR